MSDEKRTDPKFPRGAQNPGPYLPDRSYGDLVFDHVFDHVFDDTAEAADATYAANAAADYKRRIVDGVIVVGPKS